MTYSLTSIRSNRQLRVVGLVAAVASLAAACGTSSVPSADADGVVAASTNEFETMKMSAPGAAAVVDAVAHAATSDSTEQSDTTPTPTPTTDTPAPVPAPAPAAEPAPAPEPAPTTPPAPIEPPAPTTTEVPAANDLPVLESMTVTRRGLHVSVEVTASDANDDELRLAVVAHNTSTDQTFEVAEPGNTHTFEFDFDAGGLIAVTAIVDDGGKLVTATDHVEIASLKRINISAGELWAAKACFANGPIDYVASEMSMLALETSDYRPNVYHQDALSATLDFQTTGTQIFRSGQSLDFEQDLGFNSHVEVFGTFGDIDVELMSVKDHSGSFTSTFVSPGNAACWLKVFYISNITDAA